MLEATTGLKSLQLIVGFMTQSTNNQINGFLFKALGFFFNYNIKKVTLQSF